MYSQLDHMDLSQYITSIRYVYNPPTPILSLPPNEKKKQQLRND